MASTVVTPPRERSRRSVVAPLILLAVGVTLLLNNFGVVPWSIWGTLWPFWPVLFVLLGVEALVTGRLSWGGLLFTLLLVGIGGLTIGTAGAFGPWRHADHSPGPAQRELRQPLEGATRAQVRIEYGAGIMDIGALTDGDNLLNATLYGDASSGIETRYRVRNGVGELRIEPSGHFSVPFWSGGGEHRLDLRLSRSVPIDLRIEAGATRGTIDLRELQVPNLTLETGASRTDLTLPATGQTRATVEGGAAAMSITVPDGVAARVRVDDALSNVTVDQSRFPRQGEEFRSPNYDTAANRVDLSIEVGAADVRVQ
jgi:hypothetical protein